MLSKRCVYKYALVIYTMKKERPEKAPQVKAAHDSSRIPNSREALHLATSCPLEPSADILKRPR